MRSLILLAGAYTSFVVANLIHNNLSLDPAVVPATVRAAVNAWRRRRWSLLAAAFMIALPALYFFRWNALAVPTTRAFANHFALLLAAVLAVASAGSGLRTRLT
jgi:hypothetical protein